MCRLERVLSYTVTAASYLTRAKTELASGDSARLFYAAFELRAAIEARLQEYLEHALDVPKRQKRDWSIAKLGLSVERAFQLEQVARVEIRSRASGDLLLRVFYTPVSNELRKLGEKLGDYLHAIEYRESNDPWWEDMRTKLKVGCHLLEEAIEGHLLGPPLVNRQTGRMWLRMNVPSGIDVPRVIVKGGDYLLDVRYFASLANARGDAE